MDQYIYHLSDLLSNAQTPKLQKTPQLQDYEKARLNLSRKISACLAAAQYWALRWVITVLISSLGLVEGLRVLPRQRSRTAILLEFLTDELQES